MHSGPQNRATRYLRLLSGRRDMRLAHKEALSPLLYPGRVVSEPLRPRNSVIPPSSLTHRLVRVYDEVGNLIETHEHAGDFKEW